MPRYKEYSYEQTKMIPISYERQILPGSFEYALDHIIEKEMDLSIFKERYHNDHTGAPAFNPAILLKIILYAYSRGITTSRKIASCCEENVIFMALSADTRPHFTTIADFVSSMQKEIPVLFNEVLLICDEMKLIGRDMFAVDGCKLPSNASKEWSGTRKDFERKHKKFERAISYLVEQHNTSDQKEAVSGIGSETGEQQHIEALRSKAEKIRKWLGKNDDRRGSTGKVIQSNMTDNESAKMATSHGVIQGYNGVATVDALHQVVVHAEAFGSGQEHTLLMPMLEGAQANLDAIGNNKGKKEEENLSGIKVVADSGYHCEDNMKKLFEGKIDAYVPDTLFRKRDPRFAEADRYRDGLHTKKLKSEYSEHFKPADFTYDKEKKTCICPNGKEMNKQGDIVIIRGYRAVRFKSRVGDCATCTLRPRCLRNTKSKFRMVSFFEKKKEEETSFTKKMIEKIDSAAGRFFYSRRMGIVEPVFANVRSTRGLDRFTLRGKIKVNVQWLLYCIVHNIGKIHTFGAAYA